MGVEEKGLATRVSPKQRKERSLTLLTASNCAGFLVTEDGVEQATATDGEDKLGYAGRRW